MYGIKKNYLIFSSVNPFLIQDSSQTKQICSDKIDDEAARRDLIFLALGSLWGRFNIKSVCLIGILESSLFLIANETGKVSPLWDPGHPDSFRVAIAGLQSWTCNANSLLSHLSDQEQQEV